MSSSTLTSADAEITGTADDLGPMPQLVFAWPPVARAPAARPLMRGTLTLGRGLDPLGTGPLADRRISRAHARLDRRADGWWLTDLGSRNGTRVGGRPLTAPHRLRNRDVVRVGDTLLVFRHAPLRSATALATDPQHPLVGISPDIGLLRTDLAAIAPRPISVLVLGETGTGKEVVARALHAASGRTGRLVALNCAAVPPALLESTLFGHARGAFTGADRDQLGLIRESDGGTLFLDELGEMPPALQVRLLRVLESRTVRPVGGRRDHPVDLRVVCATHRDLAAAVRRGDFRLDLYGRLAQWTVRLTPLRDRPEDVPPLAARFTDRALDAAMVEALMVHRWPLNARGLAAALARAAIRRPNGPLKLDGAVREALAEEISLVAEPGEPAAADPAPVAAGEPRTEAELTEPRDPPEAAALVAALTTHRGRVASAARALDASRQQIYRWIGLYNLDLDDYRR